MDLETLLLLLPIVLVSLTLHELAHAWVAWRLGDPTAKDQGRLTLNPLLHLDPLGTTMFVLTALLANLPPGQTILTSAHGLPPKAEPDVVLTVTDGVIARST